MSPNPALLLRSSLVTVTHAGMNDTIHQRRKTSPCHPTATSSLVHPKVQGIVSAIERWVTSFPTSVRAAPPGTKEES